MGARFAQVGAELWWEGGPRAVTYGAVAHATGERKSLVSHHYRTQKALLMASAEVLARRVVGQVAKVAKALEAIDPALRPPDEAIAAIAAGLLADERRPAIVLLEIAALAISDDDYLATATAMLLAVDASLALAAPDGGGLLRSVLLGELLLQVPLPESPVALLGLPARIARFRDPSLAGGELLRGLARLQDDPIPEGPPATPAPLEEDRPNRILHAAVRLLARGQEPSHRAIAAEAGLPLAATTYYFRSRISILEHVYAAIVEAAEQRASLLDGGPGNKPERLLQLIGAMLPFYVSAQSSATLAHLNLALLAARTPPLREWAARAHEAEIRSIEAYLPETAPISRELARGVLAFLSGLVLGHLIQGRVSLGAIRPPPR